MEIKKQLGLIIEAAVQSRYYVTLAFEWVLFFPYLFPLSPSLVFYLNT